MLLFFGAVLVIYTEDCACKGEDFAEGGEDGRINNTNGRDTESGNYKQHTKNDKDGCKCGLFLGFHLIVKN